MRAVIQNATLVGLAITLAGIAPLAFQAPWPDTGGSVRPLDRGNQSQIEEPLQVVVRSEKEWADLWRRHASNRPLPPVDFARDMVVGVFLGNQPTAGYGVEIVGSRLEGGTMVVRYRATRPPQDAIVVQMLTSPYHLVSATRQSGEVRFEKVE